MQRQLVGIPLARVHAVAHSEAPGRDEHQERDERGKGGADGEAWAVCFFLKTQGYRRGYTERATVTTQNVDMSTLTEDQLERIAAGEDVVAVLAASRKG